MLLTAWGTGVGDSSRPTTERQTASQTDTTHDQALRVAVGCEMFLRKMVRSQYLPTYATASSPGRNRQCEQCVVASTMSPPLYLNWQNGDCSAEENGTMEREERKGGRRGDVAICNETARAPPFATLVPSSSASVVRADIIQCRSDTWSTESSLQKGSIGDGPYIRALLLYGTPIGTTRVLTI